MTCRMVAASAARNGPCLSLIGNPTRSSILKSINHFNVNATNRNYNLNLISNRFNSTSARARARASSRAIPNKPSIGSTRSSSYSSSSSGSSSSSSSNSSSTTLTSTRPLMGVLSGFTLAYLMNRFYLDSSPVQLEQSHPTSPSSSSEELDFAPSIEEQEESAISNSNLFIRTIHSITSTLTIYILEPLGTTKRFIYLAFLFIPVILSSPMLLVGARREGGRLRGRKLSKKNKGQRWGAVWWYAFLVKQMERAGPTFIKLGQWAGSRQDLFPKELCDLLGKLHANGKPHSFKYTKKCIESVFNRPFEEIFEEFGMEPLGIGAVGQVYKATLKKDLLPPAYLSERHRSPKSKNPTPTKTIQTSLGLSFDEDNSPPLIPSSTVAIKILHPKVHKTISRDIKIMTFFASILNLLPGAEWLSLPEEVEVFSSMMFEQLDLRNEANNLNRFERNFDRRRSMISFPRPLNRFSTKELLIEEFEDAVPLKWFLNNGGANFDHRIANLGLDAFLNMLLLDNFTHADLHPGNIMIKFYKPTTKSILNDFLKRILSKFDSDYATSRPSKTSSSILPSSKGSSPQDEKLEREELQDEEKVVSKLMSLKHSQDDFLDYLDVLDEKGYQPELVFLDAGLTVELTPLNRKNFLDLFSAVAEFDGALAGHLMVERCRAPEMVIDEEKFALRMQDLILSVKSKSFSLATIKISDVLSKVLSAVRDHHVKMEADFVNTVISILLLEGIGRQLDPNMDLFRSALPILRSLGRQLSKEGSGSLGSNQHATPMLKIWFALEARSWLLSIADQNTVEAFVRYDWWSGP